MIEPAAAHPLIDEHWRAIQGRDPAYDGAFVYAVTTTGIYCRPTCPARRPGRARVRVFSTGADARAAGFRACKRCRPDDRPNAVALAERAARLIGHALASADAHTPTLADLGRALRLSPTHVQRLFKRVTGVSPKAYARALRHDRFQAGLGEGQSVTDALYGAGFNAPSRLYAETSRVGGMTPGVMAKGGAGETIRYATAPSPLGRLLVACTERGLCAVSLGASDEALVSELRHRFPRAQLVAAAHALGAELAAVLAAIDCRAPARALAQDVRATAFQKQVWDALAAIPAGETRSYGEIAQALGRPKGARAVAAACAANPLAVVVPCHRAVRGTGDLAGYRWGIALKRQLLAAERRAKDRDRADGPAAPPPCARSEE